MSKESFKRHLEYLSERKKESLSGIVELIGEDADFFFANVGYQMEQDFSPRKGERGSVVLEQAKILENISKKADALLKALTKLDPTLLQPIEARVGNNFKIPLPVDHPFNGPGYLSATDSADVIEIIKTISYETKFEASHYKKMHGDRIYDHSIDALSKAWPAHIPVKFHDNSQFIKYLSIVLDMDIENMRKTVDRSRWKERFLLANPRKGTNPIK